MTTTLATAVLRNIDTENATSGVAVAALIMAEANRREHLNGGVESIAWNRTEGIGVLVDDEGQMIHLSNALGLDLVVGKVKNYNSGGTPGNGFGRRGTFAGYRVTVWYIEV
jgi:hypothetical protein